MKHTLKYSLLSLISLITLAGLVAYVSPITHAVECQVLSSDVCETPEVPETVGDTGVWKLLLLIINIFAAGVGIAAVGGIVYGAVMYTTASGNQERVKKAKSILLSVTIGIVAFAGMFALLQWLMPGGVFNSGSLELGKPASRSETATDDVSASDAAEARAFVLGQGGPSSTVDGAKKPTIACYWNYKSTSQPSGKIYHIPKDGSRPYAFENSLTGVSYAAKNGYKHIDIDLQITKDGVVVATHTADPLRKDLMWGGFKDPTGKLKIGSTKKISEMTWAEVSRLEHRKGGYKIRKVETIIERAKKVGISLRFELKKFPAAVWKSKLPSIAAALNKHKVKGHIAMQTNKPGYKEILNYANKLGFWTKVLNGGKWHKPTTDSSVCKK